MSNDTIKISDLAILMDKAKKYDELLIINKRVELSCSFCGKSQSSVRLVAGPRVNICEECVELCNSILGFTTANASICTSRCEIRDNRKEEDI